MQKRRETSGGDEGEERDKGGREPREREEWARFASLVSQTAKGRAEINNDLDLFRLFVYCLG